MSVVTIKIKMALVRSISLQDDTSNILFGF